jgi:hypothetical protein
MQKKEEFLRDLDVKNEREKEDLRAITPLSETLKSSIDMIGH